MPTGRATQHDIARRRLIGWGSRVALHECHGDRGLCRLRRCRSDHLGSEVEAADTVAGLGKQHRQRPSSQPRRSRRRVREASVQAATVSTLRAPSAAAAHGPAHRRRWRPGHPSMRVRSPTWARSSHGSWPRHTPSRQRGRADVPAGTLLRPTSGRSGKSIKRRERRIRCLPQCRLPGRRPTLPDVGLGVENLSIDDKEVLRVLTRASKSAPLRSCSRRTVNTSLPSAVVPRPG